MNLRRDSLVSLGWLCTVALFVPYLAGCGSRDGIQRVLVSGTVTYEGTPIAKGQIRFQPLPGVVGPVTVEPIEDGRYATKNTGGVPVGDHRVEVLGWDPVEYASASKAPYAPPVPQYVPSKYNERSELTLSLEATPRKQTYDLNLSR